IAAHPTPLAYVALGDAEATRGHVDAALAAYDKALALVPAQPAATIARARLTAAGGKLPADLHHPEDDLGALVAAGPASGGDLVSRSQVGWASLALGEVKLARGDPAGAKLALAAAAESR